MRSWIQVAAVTVPILVAAAAGLARGLVAGAGAALVLVLVLVAVSVAGDRLAGVLAALSSAASFDYFLTPPYHRFAILERDDIETTVLLLAIGLAVTEIVVWGRRQHARSDRREGYLSGVAQAARLSADGMPRQALGDQVAAMIREVLDLDACRFVDGCDAEVSPSRPVLHRDGSVEWDGRTVDVRREGLPGMDVIELPAGHRGEAGCFLLTASSLVRRPDLEQLAVAVILAEQVTSRSTAPGEV